MNSRRGTISALAIGCGALIWAIASSHSWQVLLAIVVLMLLLSLLLSYLLRADNNSHLVEIHRKIGVTLNKVNTMVDTMGQLLDIMLEIDGVEMGAMYVVENDQPCLVAGQPLLKSDHVPTTPTVLRAEGKHVLVRPIHYDQQIVAILAIASSTPYRPSTQSLITASTENIGGCLARIKMEEKPYSEEIQLRTFLQNVDDMVYFQGLDGTLAMLNHANARITGYSIEEFAQNPSLWESIVHPDDVAIAQEFFAQHPKGVPAFRVEYRLRAKSGEWRWIQSHMVGVKNPNGEYIGYNCVDRDITDQKLTEAELQETASLLRATIESTAEAIVVCDTAGNVISLNQRFIDVWALPDNWRNLPSPKARWKIIQDQLNDPMAFEALISIWLQDLHREDQATFRLKWGRVVECRTRPYRVGNKNVGRVFTFLDVTVQREAEEQIRRHNHQLEALRKIALALGSTLQLTDILNIMLEQLPTLIPCDSASIALIEGHQVLLSFGWGLPDQSIHNIAEKLGTMHPLWQQIITDQAPLILDDVRLDDRWVANEGAENIHGWMGVPLLYRDQVLGLLFLDKAEPGFYTAEHATLAMAFARQLATAVENARLFEQLEQRVNQRTAELRAQKEQSDLILQHIDNAITFSDPQGHILYVNPAWEKLSGYTSEETIGASVDLLARDSEDAEQIKTMWATVNTGKTWRGELKNRRKDGTQYDAEIVIVPVLDDHEQIKHFVEVQRDVTESRRLEQMKTRFVADAAHDLRNPIQVLQMRTSLLRIDPEMLEEHVGVIEYQIQRLEELVNDLLMLSRFDRGVLHPQLRSVDLNDLVQRVVTAQQSLASDKGVSLQFEADPSVPHLQLDTHQIERVIVNLLSNALNSTMAGDHIIVKTVCQPEHIVLCVEDSGAGIDTADLPYIFDPFFRGQNSQIDGTGLGLAIVREIVALHQGQIEVSSTPATGSTFRVILPR